MSRVSVFGLEPATYTRHALHGEGNQWVEKNCYIDVWIEALHAAGLEPLALMPFTLASDFDGDQWTFYKPPHGEIQELYGVSVQELNVYKPILEHSLYHAARGRLVFTEADAFFMPDTQGTDYHTHHTKSTIAIESIDVERRELRYFHNAGYYELSGDDFVQLFRLEAAPDPTFLPLFAELAKFDRVERLPRAELAARSERLLSTWFSRRPTQNPLERHGEQFPRDIEELRTKGIDAYHAYAFASIRQCGSNFELLAAHLRWLGGPYEAAAAHFDAISLGSKAMILKGARAVSSKKPFDFSETFRELARSWEQGIASLGELLRA